MAQLEHLKIIKHEGFVLNKWRKEMKGYCRSQNGNPL